MSLVCMVEASPRSGSLNNHKPTHGRLTVSVPGPRFQFIYIYRNLACQGVTVLK